MMINYIDTSGAVDKQYDMCIKEQYGINISDEKFRFF